MAQPAKPFVLAELVKGMTQSVNSGAPAGGKLSSKQETSGAT